MRPVEILQLYDHQMRQDPPPGLARIYKKPGLTYLTVPPPSPFAGWVLYTRLDDENLDNAIEETIGFFDTHGGEFEWKVYDHDTPPDLKSDYSSAGFVTEEVESLLAIDLHEAPPDFWRMPAQDIRRVYTPAELAEVAQIQTDVWDEPFSELPHQLARVKWMKRQTSSAFTWPTPAAKQPPPPGSAFIPSGFSPNFMAIDTGSLSRPGDVSGTGGGPRQEARKRGIRFLTVDASPMSRPILQKLGFVFLTYTQPFVWKAAQ